MPREGGERLRPCVPLRGSKVPLPRPCPAPSEAPSRARPEPEPERIQNPGHRSPLQRPTDLLRPRRPMQPMQLRRPRRPMQLRRPMQPQPQPQMPWLPSCGGIPSCTVHGLLRFIPDAFFVDRSPSPPWRVRALSHWSGWVADSSSSSASASSSQSSPGRRGVHSCSFWWP